MAPSQRIQNKDISEKTNLKRTPNDDPLINRPKDGKKKKRKTKNSRRLHGVSNRARIDYHGPIEGHEQLTIGHGVAGGREEERKQEDFVKERANQKTFS